MARFGDHGLSLGRGTQARVVQGRERIPPRRLGSPQEVTAVILYLCGLESSYITGAEIPVNGGQDVY